MKRTITVFKGDGIGPEITDWSMRFTMSVRLNGREMVH